MSYKIDVHDYNVRIKNTIKFLAAGNKVKVLVIMKGREAQHRDLAYKLLERFMGDLDNQFTLEKKPSEEGRNVSMVLAPLT